MAYHQGSPLSWVAKVKWNIKKNLTVSLLYSDIWNDKLDDVLLYKSDERYDLLEKT